MRSLNSALATFLVIVVFISLLGSIQSLSLSVPARLLVLETLVPGQRLDLEAEAPASFWNICKNEKEPLIVVGRQGRSLHFRGIEVFVENGNTIAATGRIAEITERGEDEGSRWAGRSGEVKWLGRLVEDDNLLSDDDNKKPFALEELHKLSDTLMELSKEWEELVRVTGRERFPGHLDEILQDLGDRPSQPNARALWIAGLVNPHPALGVALEIRPAILTAKSTHRRLVMTEQGLRDSISRLRCPGPCF